MSQKRQRPSDVPDSHNDQTVPQQSSDKITLGRQDNTKAEKSTTLNITAIRPLSPYCPSLLVSAIEKYTHFHFI